MSLFKRNRTTTTKVEYTLKLTPDAEKFIELLSLPYEERRKRALELLGERTFDELVFGDKVRGGGLFLRGIEGNIFGSHEDKLLTIIGQGNFGGAKPKIVVEEVCNPGKVVGKIDTDANIVRVSDSK